MYEDASDALSSEDVVVFYSDWFDVCYNEISPAFSYKGTDYENVASLVAKLGPELAAGAKNLTFYDGLDLLIPSVNYCHSFDGETYYDPYYYGEAAYAEEAPDFHISVCNLRAHCPQQPPV